MRKTITTLFAVALFALTVRGATNFTLNSNSLPSAQGWTYVGSVSESNVFSLSGGVLVQNSIGLGGGYGYYTLSGAIDSSLPFSLSFRGRVLQGELESSGHNAYGFGVQIDFVTHTFTLGLGAGQVNVDGSSFISTSIDTSQFHDYLFTCWPGDGAWQFSVDGSLVGTGVTTRGGAATPAVDFGDITTGANERGEWTQFAFTQRGGPTVSDTVSCIDVCWDSISNRVYQVQYRSELTTNQWSNLGGWLSGNGSTKCITDMISGEHRRFYRVVETHP
jgi:hypothetical protein